METLKIGLVGNPEDSFSCDEVYIILPYSELFLGLRMSKRVYRKDKKCNVPDVVS